MAAEDHALHFSPRGTQRARHGGGMPRSLSFVALSYGANQQMEVPLKKTAWLLDTKRNVCTDHLGVRALPEPDMHRVCFPHADEFPLYYDTVYRLFVLWHDQPRPVWGQFAFTREPDSFVLPSERAEEPALPPLGAVRPLRPDVATKTGRRRRRFHGSFRLCVPPPSAPLPGDAAWAARTSAFVPVPAPTGSDWPHWFGDETTNTSHSSSVAIVATAL